MPRKPFKKPNSQPLVGRVDKIEFGRGSILVNGMIGEKPTNKTKLEASPAIPDPMVTENDIYALNSLQLQRGRPLEELTVQIPMEYLLDNLPPGAMSKIGIPICGPPYVFNCTQENVDRRIRKYYRRWRDFWDTIRNSEYVFWPIQAERGYFVTAIFHMDKGLIDDPNFDPNADLNADVPQVKSTLFNVVHAWSVVDPQRGAASQARVDRVRERIRHIFRAEGITFRALSYRDQNVGNNVRRAIPWVPPLDAMDEWSSGIRSFALVRELIQRVLNSYCLEEGYSDWLFQEPTCGWLNVDQVRYEMMGICATNVLDDMNWNARLAIECIEEINTIQGIPEFRASLLRPDNADKHAYYPNEAHGFPRRVT